MSDPKYCSLLWKHISNEPLGHVRTCCIARDRVPDDNGREVTLGQSSVKEIFHNNYYKNIRQEIREGKMPKIVNLVGKMNAMVKNLNVNYIMKLQSKDMAI